jgi:hypothetical protein
MKTLAIILVLGFPSFGYAQTQDEESFARHGFFFAAAVGASLVKTSLPDQNEVSFSLPNFKIGYMISDRGALALYLPGSIYTSRGTGRTRDRGVEGIMPSYQYWLNSRLWFLGGAGFDLDAPAFWDVKNSSEGHYYFGPGAVTAAGYEILRKGKFVLDLQARIHLGYAYIPEGRKKGIAADLLLGVNYF